MAGYSANERGVALAIVVWFIAGMSLLVAGIVAQARVDTRMAQIHVARAKAVAAGDGAIQLMMVDLLTGGNVNAGTRPQPRGQFRLGGEEVTVVLVPSAGLIDVNAASAEVLAALFRVAGGLSEDEARLVADNMVKSRSAAAGAAASGREKVQLNSVEDLLRVQGVNRTLLDAVRDFIVVGTSVQGGINWALAPDFVLAVQARINGGQPGAGRANATGGTASAARDYRADAIVRYGDSLWLRRRWISLETHSGSALPWRTTRTEPPRVLMKDSILLDRSTDA